MNRRFLFLLTALAVAAAACGGGGASASGVASLDDGGAGGTRAAASSDESTGNGAADDTGGSGDAPTDEEALLAFTECMRDHGIDMADPTVDADGNVRLSRPAGEIDRETMRAARDACAETIAGVTQGFRNRDQTEIQDVLLEYAACMRDNGYAIDDPDFSNFGPPGEGGQAGGGRFGQIDPEDPAFQTAQEACEDILAGFGPPGGGPGRGPGGGENG